RIANKIVHLLLRDADDDGGAGDTATDSDTTGVRPDLLSMGSINGGEEANAHCCDGGHVPLHDESSHFGFGAQSEFVVPPVVIVAPVTLPPIAMPLHSAWTLTAGTGDFASGDFPGGKK